jgi:hypothetical protein
MVLGVAVQRHTYVTALNASRDLYALRKIIKRGYLF